METCGRIAAAVAAAPVVAAGVHCLATPGQRNFAMKLATKVVQARGSPRRARPSPLDADLKGLPPIDVFQRTRDLFVVNARSIVSNMRRAGTAIAYREYLGAPHVFVGAMLAPEAKDVFRRIGAALAAQAR